MGHEKLTNKEQFADELCDQLTSKIMRDHVEPLVDEIFDLKRWKREVKLLLDEWEKCYDALPDTFKPLGVLKPRAVLNYIEKLNPERSA